MGVYNSLTKASTRDAAATYDSHGVTAADVLKVGGLNPESEITWNVATPTVLKEANTASIEDAEKEELEALNYRNAVEAGVRVFKARSQKLKDNLKLVVAHRKHLGVAAKTTLGIAATNTGLAKTLQGVRVGFANLGHGLDYATQRADHQVEMIKAKYQQSIKKADN